ncbi:hypothetical protein [Streptomyces sp. NPDC054786]
MIETTGDDRRFPPALAEVARSADTGPLSRRSYRPVPRAPAGAQIDRGQARFRAG